MNTNDDFENKRLMEEIEKLENDPAIQTDEVAIKTKNPVVENLIFFGIIIAVVFGVVYLYNTKDNSSRLERVDIAEYDEKVQDTFEDDKTTYQFNEDYKIDSNDYENYDTDYARAEKTFAEQKENIEISKNIITVNKELILCIKNNNNTSIPNVYVYAVFYDGENRIVGVESTTIEALIGKQERYIKFLETPENYERVEPFITKEYFGYSVGTILNNEINYKANEDEKGNLEEIEIKNNSNQEIDIVEICIIYYGADNNILDVDKNYCFDLKKNKTDKISVYGIWNDITGEYIEYDHYEIKIDHAIVYEN